MPIKRCTLSGGSKGYKWGDSGKCYASREKALQQMRAIKSQQSKSILERVSEAYKKNLEDKTDE